MKSKLFLKTWNISIYKGDSPFVLEPMGDANQSILNGSEVTDITSNSVADPFLLRRDDKWYLFYEVVRKSDGLGKIGIASSDDLLNWEYHQLIIDEDFHLSYPQPLEDKGELYMIPETRTANAVRIYHCKKFPLEWEFEQTLIEGDLADATVFKYQGKWYMFAVEGVDNFVIYHADGLKGPWVPHAGNPLIAGDVRSSRPGGKVVVWEGKYYRIVQDGFPVYGSSVRVFEILELSPDTFREREISESPVLKFNRMGWNGAGMHHMDVHQLEDGSWIAAVDGKGIKLNKEHEMLRIPGV